MDKEKLKNLPEEPGIYRMLDKDRENKICKKSIASSRTAGDRAGQ